MLTLILCVVVSIVIFIAWRKVDDYRSWLGWVFVGILLCFGILYPLGAGSYEAEHNINASNQTLPLQCIDDTYYYFNEDNWENVLDIEYSVQSGKLMVVDYKAPFSLWYFDVTVRKAYIPICNLQYEVEGE